MKKDSLIKYYLSATIVALSLSSGAAQAGMCGWGVITEIKEGGWNSNDFMLKMDYRVKPSEYKGTEWQGFIRFPSSLGVERLRGIRSIASMALITGPRLVRIGTHTNNCSEATEISLYSDY